MKYEGVFAALRRSQADPFVLANKHLYSSLRDDGSCQSDMFMLGSSAFTRMREVNRLIYVNLLHYRLFQNMSRRWHSWLRLR